MTYFLWARVVSNHRPLACEASALPLSYAPGRSRDSRRRLRQRSGGPGPQAARCSGRARELGWRPELDPRMELDRLDRREREHLQAAAAVIADQEVELGELVKRLHDELAVIVTADELGEEHAPMVGAEADGPCRR